MKEYNRLNFSDIEFKLIDRTFNIDKNKHTIKVLNILNLISFDDEYSLPFTGDTTIAIIYKVEDDKLICIEKVKKDVLDYLKSNHYLLDDKSIEYFCVKK